MLPGVTEKEVAMIEITTALKIVVIVGAVLAAWYTEHERVTQHKTEGDAKVEVLGGKLTNLSRQYESLRGKVNAQDERITVVEKNFILIQRDTDYIKSSLGKIEQILLNNARFSDPSRNVK